MHWQRSLLILPLLVAVSCGKETPQAAGERSMQSSVQPSGPGVEIAPPARDVDWLRSAGIFIGVQAFHDGGDLEVAYAADDAVDLVWLFVHELRLLKPEQVTLLLAGEPAKETSRKHLATLRNEVRIVAEGRAPGRHECIDAGKIIDEVRAQTRKVANDGILIVSFAGHGLARAGEHRLLTADASRDAPRGVVFAEILETIKAARVERILLLIDACRSEPRPGMQWASSAQWHPQLPETFFQDVALRQTYALLASTGPGRYAYSDRKIENGYFTRAVIEGLQCHASSQPDGRVTVSNLANYVSDRVGNLSAGAQVTESRIGGLGGLRIAGCALPQSTVCEMIAPRSGVVREPKDMVKLRALQPELFATVLVCPSSADTCFNQNPKALPIETHPGEILELPVQYGGSGGDFIVRIALTTDRQFLRGQAQPVLASSEANAVVHWCTPVRITFHPKP